MSTSVIAQVQRSAASRADNLKRIKQSSADEANKTLGIKNDSVQPIDIANASTKKLAEYNKLIPLMAYRSFDAVNKGRGIFKLGILSAYLYDSFSINKNFAGNSKPASSIDYHLTKDINAAKECDA